MNCNDAIERLPWLLNGTLDPEERRQVMEHVTGCPACKAAFADTREAWSLFAQHIPVTDLIAYAAGEPPAGIDRELLEEHLASCPQCAADLELVRTSRGLAEDDGVALFAPRSQPAARPAAQPATAARLRRWRSSALAASLAGLAFLGLWIHSVGQMGTLRSQYATEQQARMQAERSEREARRVQPDLPGGPGVYPNGGVEQLSSETERGAEVPGELALSNGGSVVIPVDSEHFRPLRGPVYEIDIRTDGKLVAIVPKVKLQQHDLGDRYTLTFKPGYLQPGKTYELQVYAVQNGRREERERFVFHAVTQAEQDAKQAR